MPSTCPKCHRVLEEDEICCAQTRFTWRCKSCFKRTTGFAIPYGKCCMCGGELETIPNRSGGDGMRFHAIRDAVQFTLGVFHFYEQVREKATQPEQCFVLEYLYETALDHLHELEENYRAHLDWETVALSSDREKLLLDWPFRGILLNEDSSIADIYRAALEIEHRGRDHFDRLQGECPRGLDNELCRELAAESDEHIAMLEMELEQVA